MTRNSASTHCCRPRRPLGLARSVLGAIAVVGIGAAVGCMEPADGFDTAQLSEFRGGDGLGGHEVYEGDFVWQQMRDHLVYVRRHSVVQDDGEVHAQLFDSSVPVVDLTAVATTRHSNNGWQHESAVYIRNRRFGLNRITLDDDSARADLAWAGVRYSCDGEIVEVMAYQRPGYEPGVLWDVEDADFFWGQPSRVLGGCEAVAVIGEHFNGDFRWPIVETAIFDDTMYDLVRASVGDDEFNADFLLAAFGRTDIRFLTLNVREWTDILRGYVFGRSEDDDFIGDSDVLPGDYRVEADCGSGYEPIFPLDEVSHYESPNSGSALWDEVDDIADVYEDCDVRWGVFVEGPVQHDGGQLDGG